MKPTDSDHRGDTKTSFCTAAVLLRHLQPPLNLAVVTFYELGSEEIVIIVLFRTHTSNEMEVKKKKKKEKTQQDVTLLHFNLGSICEDEHDDKPVAVVILMFVTFADR